MKTNSKIQLLEEAVKFKLALLKDDLTVALVENNIDELLSLSIEIIKNTEKLKILETTLELKKCAKEFLTNLRENEISKLMRNSNYSDIDEIKIKATIRIIKIILSENNN